MFARTLPVHVTLQFDKRVWNLRRKAYRTVERALGDGANRFGARLLRFSVMGNHLHMLMEADDGQALVRSCRGLSIRIARRLNKLMGRSGRVLADRYHTRVLRTPTEVKRAIDYIRDNYKKHYHPDAKYAFIDPARPTRPTCGLFYRRQRPGWPESVGVAQDHRRGRILGTGRCIIEVDKLPMILILVHTFRELY